MHVIDGAGAVGFGHGGVELLDVPCRDVFQRFVPKGPYGVGTHVTVVSDRLGGQSLGLDGLQPRRLRVSGA